MIGYKDFKILNSVLISAPSTESTPEQITFSGKEVYIRDFSSGDGYVIKKVYTSGEDTFIQMYKNGNNIYKFTIPTSETESISITKDSEIEYFIHCDDGFKTSGDWAIINNYVTKKTIPYGLHAATSDRNGQGDETPSIIHNFVNKDAFSMKYKSGESYYYGVHDCGLGQVVVPSISTVEADDVESVILYQYFGKSLSNKSIQSGYAYKYLDATKSDIQFSLGTFRLYKDTVKTLSVGNRTYYYWQAQSSKLYDSIAKDVKYTVFEQYATYNDTFFKSYTSSEEESPLGGEQKCICLRVNNQNVKYYKEIVIDDALTLSNIWIYTNDNGQPTTTAPIHDSIFVVQKPSILTFQSDYGDIDADSRFIRMVSGKTSSLYENFYTNYIYYIIYNNEVLQVEPSQDPFFAENGGGFATTIKYDGRLYRLRYFFGNQYEGDVWFLSCADGLSTNEPTKFEDIEITIIGGTPQIKTFDPKYFDGDYTREDIDVFNQRNTSINGKYTSVYGCIVEEDSVEDFVASGTFPIAHKRNIGESTTICEAATFGYTLPLAYQILSQDEGTLVDVYAKFDDGEYIRGYGKIGALSIDDTKDSTYRQLDISFTNGVSARYYPSNNMQINDLIDWGGDWTSQYDYWYFNNLPSSTSNVTVKAVVRNGKHYPHVIGLGNNNINGVNLPVNTQYSFNPYIFHIELDNFGGDYWRSMSNSGTIILPQLGSEEQGHYIPSGEYHFYPNLSNYLDYSNSGSGAYAIITYNDSIPDKILRISSNFTNDNYGGCIGVDGDYAIVVDTWVRYGDNVKYIEDAVLFKCPDADVSKIEKVDIVIAQNHDPSSDNFWNNINKKRQALQLSSNPEGNTINGDITQDTYMHTMPPTVVGVNNITNSYEGDITYNPSTEQYEGTIDNYAVVVGNGIHQDETVTDYDKYIKSNAATLTYSGDLWVSGDIYTGSTSGKNRDSGSKKVLTQKSVINNDDEIEITLKDSNGTANGTIYACPTFSVGSTPIGSAIQINSDNTIIGHMSDTPTIGNFSNQSALKDIIEGPFVGTLQVDTLSVNPFVATKDAHIASKKYVDTKAGSILPAYEASDIGKVLGVVDDGSGNPILAWVPKT